jgi:hypothetical protein
MKERSLALSVTRKQFERDWQFHDAVYQRVRAKAEQHRDGKWDLDQSEAVLEPVEYDTLLVLNFVYSWENNGRFIDTVMWYKDQFDRVDRAFRRLGFHTASMLMPRALEFAAIQDSYIKSDLPLAPEVAAEVDRINEAASADVNDQRLTAAIASRAQEFTV